MKSLKRFKVLLGLALVSSLALGAAASGSWSGIDLMQRWMKGGFYVGTTATLDSQNKVSAHFTTSCTFDFPALSPVNGASATAQSCAVSWVCDAGVGTGSAGFGARCNAASNLGADGGAALDDAATLACRSLGNGGVKFQLCWNGKDAGTYDLGDAGFTADLWQ